MLSLMVRYDTYSLSYVMFLMHFHMITSVSHRHAQPHENSQKEKYLLEDIHHYTILYLKRLFIYHTYNILSTRQ